jgi:hypothetical protein
MKTINPKDYPFAVDLVEGKRTHIFELLPSSDAKLVKLTAIPLTGASIVDSLSLFGSVDSIPTPETYQFSSLPLWNKG